MRVNLPRFTLSRMRRLILLLIAAMTATPCAAEDMATGFVYLRDVDPTMLQDMRYAGPGNFTGHAVPGYDAPECVLVREAADALKVLGHEEVEAHQHAVEEEAGGVGAGAAAVGEEAQRHERPGSAPLTVTKTAMSSVPSAERCAPSGKLVDRSASVDGASVAAPMPCTARAAIIPAGDCARPTASEAAVKRPMPSTKVRRRPSRSPARAPGSSRPPNVSV